MIVVPACRRIAIADFESTARSTRSATQWDVAALISAGSPDLPWFWLMNSSLPPCQEMSDPANATAPPASALSDFDLDLDGRGPILTPSLAPSLTATRPRLRVPLRRNAGVLTRLVSVMRYATQRSQNIRAGPHNPRWTWNTACLPITTPRGLASPEAFPARVDYALRGPSRPHDPIHLPETLSCVDRERAALVCLPVLLFPRTDIRDEFGLVLM